MGETAMKRTKIFKILVGAFIALLLTVSSSIITARETETLGNNLLMKYTIRTIPENIKTELLEPDESYLRDPPDWADGWYVGIWFDKDGDEYTLLGYMAGYYHKGGQNRGYYGGVWNNTDNTTVGAMVGIYFGIFTFGRIHLSEENKIPFSGFLMKNETHYVGRVMSFVGDPVYMYGVHQPLQ